MHICLHTNNPNLHTAYFEHSQDTYFASTEVLPIFLVLLLAYGVSVTPCMYGLSLLFHSPATAYVTLFCLNFFLGFAVLIIDAVIVYNRGFSPNERGRLLQTFLVVLPIPSYGLARSMLYFTADRPLQRVAASLTFEQPSSPFSDIWPLVLSQLLWAVVYTVLLFVVEYFPLLKR